MDIQVGTVNHTLILKADGILRDAPLILDMFQRTADKEIVIRRDYLRDKEIVVLLRETNGASYIRNDRDFGLAP